KKLIPRSRHRSMSRAASMPSVFPQRPKNSFVPPKVPVPKLRMGTCRPEFPNFLYSIYLRFTLNPGQVGRIRPRSKIPWADTGSRPRRAPAIEGTKFRKALFGTQDIGQGFGVRNVTFPN